MHAYIHSVSQQTCEFPLSLSQLVWESVRILAPLVLNQGLKSSGDAPPALSCLACLSLAPSLLPVFAGGPLQGQPTPVPYYSSCMTAYSIFNLL